MAAAAGLVPIVELPDENGRSIWDVAGLESGDGLLTRRTASAVEKERDVLLDEGGR